MQVCTLLQADSHASTPPLSFLQAGYPSCHPTNSIKALKAKQTTREILCLKATTVHSSLIADLSFDRFALAVDDSVWCHNAVWRWIGLNHLELNSSHASTHQKYVTFVKWPVRLKKVRLQVDIKQVAANTTRLVQT